MKHEDEPAPQTPAASAGRTRVVSAAAVGNHAGPSGARPATGPGNHPNEVRRLRIHRTMPKAELARRANLSVSTSDRVEKGFGCRMDTKRKILEALSLELTDRVRVSGEEE